MQLCDKLFFNLFCAWKYVGIPTYATNVVSVKRGENC